MLRGHVIVPLHVGADLLRLWVASEDYREDMRISDEILKYLIDSYRKIRNTFKFLLGNLYDFREEDKIPYDKLKEVDKWAVQASRKWHKEVRESYDSYDFYKVYQLSVNFINRELSSFYLDILKDRLYTFAPDSAERRSAQTVIDYMLQLMLKTLAPLLSFTCEEAWQYYRFGKEEQWEKSLFEEEFPPVDDPDAEFLKKWETVFKVRDRVLLALEELRQEKMIGNALESIVFLSSSNDETASILKGLENELYEILITSIVHLRKEERTDYALLDGDIWVGVRKNPHAKCGRCWKHLDSVGGNAAYPELCGRCREAVEKIEPYPGMEK